MSEQPNPNSTKVVASLLGTLPTDLANRVLDRLKPHFADTVRKQMATPPSAEAVSKALRELSDMQRILNRPTPPTPSTNGVHTPKPSGQLPTPEEITADPVKALRSLSAAQLFTSLASEEPHLIAGTLSCLDPSVAADFLRKLPPAVRTDLTLRLSQNISLRRDIIECVAGALVHRCKLHRDAPPEPEVPDRIGRTAIVMRALSRQERLEVFKKLEASDPEIAALVGQQLYQFADLLRIENRSLQMMLSELDIKVLARALMEAPDDIKAKVFGNLSSRGKEALTDEQSLFDKLPAAEIETARSTLLATMRSLDFEGRLTFDS